MTVLPSLNATVPFAGADEKTAALNVIGSPGLPCGTATCTVTDGVCLRIVIVAGADVLPRKVASPL